jgi:hypothetical protein
MPSHRAVAWRSPRQPLPSAHRSPAAWRIARRTCWIRSKRNVGHGCHVGPALTGSRSRGGCSSFHRHASGTCNCWFGHCTMHTVDHSTLLSQRLDLTSGASSSKVRKRRWNGARTAGEIDVPRACRSASVLTVVNRVLCTHHGAWSWSLGCEIQDASRIGPADGANTA